MRAVERTEREQILVGRKEIRLDGGLRIEMLAEPGVARLMVGGKIVAGHRIVGENDGLREMPRRNRRNRFAGVRLGQNHDAVDEFQILADRLQREIEPLRVHREEHHLAQGRGEIMRRARGDVG